MTDISGQHHHLASRYRPIHSNASFHLMLRSCNAIWATVLKHLAIQTANINNYNIIHNLDIKKNGLFKEEIKRD